MKKINHLFLVILLGILLIQFPCQKAEAAVTEGNFTYEVIGDKASITSYTGKEKNVVIPDKLGGYTIFRIDNGCFSENSTMETVQFPSGLTRIEAFAFRACTKLKEVNFPEGLTNIRYNAFDSCTNLKKAILPASLSSFGEDVFINCTSMTEITVAKDNAYYASSDNVLFSKNFDTLYLYPAAASNDIYAVPETVTEIAERAFYNAAYLKKVYVPKSVTEIKTDAFPASIKIYGVSGSAAENFANNIGASFEQGEYVAVQKISVQNSFLNLTKKDETVTVNVNVTPANATDQRLKWTSDNTAVATVDVNGNVTAKATGNTTIKVTCGKYVAYCYVYVEIPTPTYTASFNSNSYEVFATAKVKASLTSTMPGDGFVTLKSSNTAVATVANDGTITGVKKGKATITATTKSGKTITATVKVSTPTVKLNVSSLPLQVKKSTTVLKVKSKLATDSIVKWTSSKTTIASVNKKTGKITAKKAGPTYITVTMKSGATAKCKIEVKKKAVSTTKITLNAKSKTLKLKGGSKTFQITVTKTPLTSLEKITYKSSNKKIATVSSKGKITAKKAGTATITVKAGKKTAKIKVTVKKK